MEWISVKDRLPEEEEQVLCLSSKNEFFTAYYTRMTTNYEPWYVDIWNSGLCCGKEPFDTIYWMPLPELPKDECGLANNG